MTPSIDHTLHKFATLLPNLTSLPILTLLPNFGGFHRTLQRVRLANRGRLLLRTPGPVPFGTCICSYVETVLSWTCHVYGPFEFRKSLGTSILLCLLLTKVLSETSFKSFQYNTEGRRLSNYSIELILCSHYRSRCKGLCQNKKKNINLINIQREVTFAPHIWP